MINLSTAKVGYEFKNVGGGIVTIVMISDNGYQLVGKVGGSLSVFDNEGRNRDDSCYDIVSKHEPRHWLKDLPDAGLFSDDVISMECHEDGIWLFYIAEMGVISNSASWDAENTFTLIKMPTLTGDEWKQSKISIAELKTWQEANKGNSHRKLEQFKDF